MSDNTDDNENISFCIDDAAVASNTELDVSQFLGDPELATDDHKTSIMLNYQLNMTVRQLLQICDYYGIAKTMRQQKCNKDEIIMMLVDFEASDENCEIVTKRQLLWYYVNELKNDSFMKKYIFF